MRRKTFTGFVLVLVLLGIAAEAAPQDSDQAYAEELVKAQALLKAGKHEEAIKSFKKANKHRQNSSAECHWGLAETYQQLGAYKDVIKSCDRVVELASDTDLRTQALNLKGVALSLQGEKKKEKLPEAEAAFRAALELDPRLPIAHYNLAVALLKQNRDPEGIEELKAYLALSPTGSAAANARRLMENPRRARENYAPDFSFISADGEYVSSEDLQGKLLLLDFWATWCGPCRAALPDLRDLHKKRKKDAFVLISISSDSNEDKWRGFIAQEKMEWVQVLDRNRQLQRLFSVGPIPTYLVVDAEGIIRHRAVGLFETIFLDGEIKKSLKALATLPKKEEKKEEKAESAKTTELEPAPTQASQPEPAAAPPQLKYRLVTREPAADDLPAPEVVLADTEEYEAGGQLFTRYRLAVTNWIEFPDDLFAPASDLPPCGLNTNSPRTWVSVTAEDGRTLNGFCAFRAAQDLSRLWFALPKRQSPPARVAVTLSDRRRGKTYTSNLVSIPASQ